MTTKTMKTTMLAVTMVAVTLGGMAGCGGGQGTEDTGIAGDTAADVLDRDISVGDAADRDVADGTASDVEPADGVGDGGDAGWTDVPDGWTPDSEGDLVDVDSIWTDTAADTWDAMDAPWPDEGVDGTWIDIADAGDTTWPDIGVDSTWPDANDAEDTTGPGDATGDLTTDLPEDIPGDLGTDTTLPDGLAIRIVAGNLSSGNYQSWDPGHGLRILDAMNPDIALVQEFNYGSNTAADYKAFAQRVVGTDYYAVDDPGFQIPNGIVSRWPITSSGYWDDPTLTNRELLWAVIDIPGPVDIVAVSVHLHTSPSSDQIEASLVIVNKIKAMKAANPGRYMYVVGGDFNGTASVSTSGFGTDNVFYVDPPDPADDDGNVYTNANRSKQYDYVLGDPTMHAFQVPVVFTSTEDLTSRTYTDGLVFDTRIYTQAVLDEYFPPAETGDSGASSMQHMAVVKDYYIN